MFLLLWMVALSLHPPLSLSLCPLSLCPLSVSSLSLSLFILSLSLSLSALSLSFCSLSLFKKKYSVKVNKIPVDLVMDPILFW